MAPSRTSPPPSSDLSNGLTQEQLDFWDTNGYLLIPDALSQDEVHTLLSESNNMLNDFSLDEHPMTRFSTGENSQHVGDQYFLESGDKIRFFFEEGLRPPRQSAVCMIAVLTARTDAFDERGTLTKPKNRAINKIGHYLHVLSPPFQRASINTQNARIAKDLGFSDPRVLQSMVICKQPEIGGRVPPHQDSVFLYTNPPSAVGFWYALEDATVDNGCLSFAAGSHKRAPIRDRFVRSPRGNGTTFDTNEGAQWPAGLKEDTEVRKEVYTLGEVKAGTLVLIHGNLLHKSEKNTSPKGRMIYTFHMIEGGCDFDERNWLQPPAQGFTKLLAETRVS